jgi:N,N-dimethylformamidase
LTTGSLLEEIDAPFILATDGTLNGRLEDPSITVAETDNSNTSIEYVLAAWDTSCYSSEKDPWIIPCSKRENHHNDDGGNDNDNNYTLLLYRHPTRAVKGHKWNGTEFDWRKCPSHYGAIHFHEDDIYDFRWEPNIEWKVKEGTPSGIYIVRFVTYDEHEYEEALPIFICSSPNVSKNKLVVLIPTFTYVMYGNHARPDFEEDLWTARIQSSPGAYPYNPCKYPKYGWSTYNFHSDMYGIHFASHLRPLLNLRPGYITFSREGGHDDNNPDTQGKSNTSFCSGLRHFPADSHLICWLDHFGYQYDIVTDHELHREGLSAINQYSTLITTSHPEYHTRETVEALQIFRDDVGGNLIYLGGNGFYWRIAASADTANSDDKAETSCKLLEIRRSESGVRTWAAECGEYYNFLDGGSMGGLWRNSGRPPWKLVGIGFASQGSFVGKPYYRTCFDCPDVTDWVFRGIDDEILGDFGFSGDGAAGYELDRIDPADPKVQDGEIVILAQAYTKYDRRFILVPEDGT